MSLGLQSWFRPHGGASQGDPLPASTLSQGLPLATISPTDPSDTADPARGTGAASASTGPQTAGHRVLDFPAEELATPFAARGPVVHVEAIRALARARTHLRRRSLPADGSFESMVDGGLLTERGRLTGHGLSIARMLATSQMRVRVHAATGTVPLVLEAHALGSAVLLLVTQSPAQLLAHPGSAGIGPFQADPGEHIGLDLVSPGYLPVAIANWAGLRPSEADPPQLTYTVPWAQVEAKFTGQLEDLPAADDPQPAPEHPDGTVEGLSHDDDTADGQGWIWQQHWVGWAISTEPATRNMTIVRAGEHSYRLTRPNEQNARLTWIPPEGVWLEVSGLVRDALGDGHTARMP